MAISLTPVTGSVPMPDGEAFTTATLVMRLSGPETEGAAAIPAYEAKTVLDGVDIPSGFAVFPNAAGFRDTSYTALIVGTVTTQSGVAVRREFTLGTGIRVGESASYSIGELIDAADTGAALELDYGLITTPATRTADYGSIA